MEGIEYFIEEWQDNSSQIYSDHIDYFLDKTTFDYNDCLLVMEEVRSALDEQGLNNVKLMIQIQCGKSRRIQEWGEQFWQLVDASLTPPEIYIGQRISMDSSVSCQQIYSKNQIENIENYIAFYPDNNEYIRCLNIVEKEVSDV